jgi:hypothetical protein
MQRLLSDEPSDEGQVRQCLGTTRKGQRCKNAPLQGKEHCLHHQRVRRVRFTVILSVVVIVPGIAADLIGVTTYFGVDLLRKAATERSSIQDVNCIYSSNYRFLYFSDKLSSPVPLSPKQIYERLRHNVTKLHVTVGFKNISANVLRDVQMEVHASPILLVQEIYPYSSGDTEIVIYATSRTHVQRMESITTANILADIHPTLLENLFLDNYFTIAGFAIRVRISW